MTHLTVNKIVILVSLVLMAAFSSWAFAVEKSTPACPKADMMGYHHGGSPDTPCCMAGKNISKEDMAKIQAERERFAKETESLRMDIRSKQLAVRSELAKAAPDANNALLLQKQLSELEAQVDQKRIAHILEVKKISPSAGLGCMGDGMKHGMHQGPGKMSGDCPMKGR